MLRLAACLLLLTLTTGCRPDACRSAAPAFQLDIQLAPQLDGRKITRLQVDIEAGGKRRDQQIEVAGRLDDRATSIAVDVGAAGAGGFTAVVQVTALDAAGQVQATGRGSFAGQGDACNVFRLSIGAPDAGPDVRPADVGVVDHRIATDVPAADNRIATDLPAADLPPPVVLKGKTLACDFDSQGLYAWNSGVSGNWLKLGGLGPKTLGVYGNKLVASYEGTNPGVFEHNGTTWKKLGSSVAEGLVGTDSVLYADLGTAGLWKYDGTAWAPRLSAADPNKMLVFAGKLAVDFPSAGSSQGLYVYDGSSWPRVRDTSVPALEMIAGVGNVFYVTYPDGLSKYDGGSFSKIDSRTPTRIATYGTNKKLVAAFSATELEEYDDATLKWKVISLSPKTVGDMIGTSSTLYYVDVGQNTIWAYDGSPQHQQVSDPQNASPFLGVFDSDLIAVYPASAGPGVPGIWRRSFVGGQWQWTRLSPSSASQLVEVVFK